MLSRAFSLAVGCRRFRVSGAPGGLSALLIKFNLPVWGMEADGEGGVFFFVSLLHQRRLLRLCREHGYSPVPVALYGLPRLVSLYKKRFGFLLGAAFFVFFIHFCSSLVWDVRVFGAEPSDGLSARFALAGLREGMRVSEFDEELFRSAFLAQNPGFTFVSASVVGSTAVVRLNPRVPEPEMDDPSRPANLVAVREGVIVRCEAGRGIPLVSPGDCVAPGQILVSGVSETPSGAFTLHRSEGRVLARTKRRFETSVEVGAPQKRYTGDSIDSLSLCFLGENIKIFDFSGNPGELYDTIEERRSVSLFGAFRLPFTLVLSSRLPYRTDAAPADEKAAERILYDRYHAFVAEKLSGAEILASEVSVRREGNVLFLTADLSVIEDIALVSEIRITDPPG